MSHRVGNVVEDALKEMGKVSGGTGTRLRFYILAEEEINIANVNSSSESEFRIS
jgi:hypothetical protein